jgi:hypothetical protein
MMSGSDREDDFEAYHKRRVPIDRRLRSLRRLEPPAELDRLIIGQAREAIQGAPPVRVFRAPRWALPMGLAATILISLSILLDLGMQGAIRKDAGKASAVWVGVLPESSRSAAEPQTPQAAAAVSGGVTAPAMAPAPSPAAPGKRISASSAASPAATSAAASARQAERMRPAPFTAAPWPTPPDSGALSTAAAKAAPFVAEAANSAGATSAAATTDDSRSRVVEHTMAASRLRRSADASGTGSAEPVSTAPPAEAHMEIVTVIGTRVHESYAMSAAAAPVASISSEAVSSAPSYVPDTSNIQVEGGLSWAAERHRHPNPKVWLDHIKKMRAAGLAAEADQELRRFHDAYPDFPAPPDTPSTDGRAQ